LWLFVSEPHLLVPQKPASKSSGSSTRLTAWQKRAFRHDIIGPTFACAGQLFRTQDCTNKKNLKKSEKLVDAFGNGFYILQIIKTL